MGSSAFIPRPHSTWPVAASARIAPLAFTPCGAPVTSISGPAGELLGRGRTVGAGDPCASAAVDPPADRALDPVSVTTHAVMPPPMTTAAAVTATIRAVSRMAWLTPATVDRSASRAASGGRRSPPHSTGRGQHLADGDVAGRSGDSTGAGEPGREDHGNDRQQDDDGHHGVDLGELLAEADRAEDPQRQGVLRARGEHGDDDLVERQAEG